MSDQSAVQLPEYVCHKRVYAAKILSADDVVDSAGMKLSLDNGGYVEVSYAWGLKHVVSLADLVGGYYVVYKDGYASWSPAKAFEEGYSRV